MQQHEEGALVELLPLATHIAEASVQNNHEELKHGLQVLMGLPDDAHMEVLLGMVTVLHSVTATAEISMTGEVDRLAGKVAAMSTLTSLKDAFDGGDRVPDLGADGKEIVTDITQGLFVPPYNLAPSLQSKTETLRGLVSEGRMFRVIEAVAMLFPEITNEIPPKARTHLEEVASQAAAQVRGGS